MSGNFSSIDLGIVLAYFAMMIGIGIYLSRRAQTKEDFIVAGRGLPLPQYTAAMAAVVIGGGCTMGVSTLSYQSGISGIWIGGVYAVSILLLSFLLRTKLSNMRILSACEGFGVFYGPYARTLSAVVMLVYLFMIAVLQMVSIGTVLEVMLGWPKSVSMLVGGLVVLVYVVIGGMWAVTWTDIIQFIIMTVGVIIVCPALALRSVGGFSYMVSQLPAAHLNVTTIGMAAIVAKILLLTPGFLVGQDIWQRAFTGKDQKVARTGTALAAGYIFIYTIALIIIALCLFVAVPDLEDSNLAFATAAVHFSPVGVQGVLLAAALASIMSTASSGILGSATVVYNDMIAVKNKDISDKTAVMLTRVISVIIGALAIVCSLWIQDVLVALDVAYDILSGCIFVPLIAAFMLKKVSARAGLYSLAASFVTVIIFFIKDGLSATTPIIFGIAVSAIVFFSINAIDKKKQQIDIMEDGTVIVDGVKKENAY